MRKVPPSLVSFPFTSLLLLFAPPPSSYGSRRSPPSPRAEQRVGGADGEADAAIRDLNISFPALLFSSLFSEAPFLVWQEPRRGSAVDVKRRYVT